jgi:hypothetical protein
VLAQAIINRTILRPVTFDDWADATQTQHAIWVKTQAVMGMQQTPWQDNFNTPQWWMAMGWWPL